MVVPRTEVLVSMGATALARYVIEPGEYVIGREAGCNIVVDADLVSRSHAKLTVHYDELFIEDAGSSNGTFIDGKPVTECTRLWPNQKVQVGTATLEFRRLKAGDDGQSIPPVLANLRRLLPAEILGERKYQVGDLVARGGMGMIFGASDSTIRRKVAMKVMIDQGNTDELLRFIHEAQVTGQLQHANIVPVHELGVDENDRVFYTMKLVKGVTLRFVLEKLRDGDAETLKRYDLRRLLIIFLRVCDAVAFAHSKDIIHRDLKPENLMIGDFGEVFVMDWGLAKVAGNIERKEAPEFEARSIIRSVRVDEGEAGSTMAGTIVGTPNFMAPEQAEGLIENVDARSDIFSLGGILYQILTLRMPFTGRNANEVLENLRAGKVLPPASYNRDESKKIALAHCPARRVPESLSAVAMKALAHKPEDRYQSALQFKSDVDAWLAGFATTAENAGVIKSILLLIKRNKAVFAVAFGAFLILAAMAAWFVIDVTSERTRVVKTLNELRGTAPTFYAQAQALVDEQKFEDALQKVNYAISLEPDEPDYHNLKGDILQSMLSLDGAASEFAQVLKLQGNYPAAQENLALCEKVARENPNATTLLPASLAELADAMSRQGRIAEAIALAPRAGIEQKFRYDAAFAKLKAMVKFPYSQNSAFEKRLTLESSGLFSLDLRGLPITDLPPLKGIPLGSLNLSDLPITDLSPLKGIPLRSLAVCNCVNISDLRPLEGMPLEELNIAGTKVSDLTPLRGMPISHLDMGGTWRIHDLSALKGMPLRTLNAGWEPFTDLSPLAGMQLNELFLNSCRGISDFRPLAGMPLNTLVLSDTRVTDLSVLKGMPLRWLALERTSVSDLAPLAENTQLEVLTIPAQAANAEALQRLPNLRRLAYENTIDIWTQDGVMLATDFWKNYDPQKQQQAMIDWLRNKPLRDREDDARRITAQLSAQPASLLPQKSADGVLFQCYAPGAHVIYLAGNFNNWANNTSTYITDRKFAMQGPDERGIWRKVVKLAAGNYAFKFYVDGEVDGEPPIWFTPDVIAGRDGDDNGLFAVTDNGDVVIH